MSKMWFSWIALKYFLQSKVTSASWMLKVLEAHKLLMVVTWQIISKKTSWTNHNLSSSTVEGFHCHLNFSVSCSSDGTISLGICITGIGSDCGCSSIYVTEDEFRYLSRWFWQTMVPTHCLFFSWRRQQLYHS